MVEIKDNLLSQDTFIELKKVMQGFDFPWFFQYSMTSHGLGREKPYFCHTFFDNNQINSPFFPVLEPCLKALKCKAIIRVRANLNCNYNESHTCDWHTDVTSKSKTAVVYINDNNGITEIKNNNKIEQVRSISNRALIFDAHHEHRLIAHNDVPRRIIINFNYYD